MKILVIPADGIGPEIVSAAETVLTAANEKFSLGLKLEHDIAEFESLEKFWITIRPELLEKAKDFGGVILGTQSRADYPATEEGGVNISESFRVGLEQG